MLAEILVTGLDIKCQYNNPHKTDYLMEHTERGSF